MGKLIIALQFPNGFHCPNSSHGGSKSIPSCLPGTELVHYIDNLVEEIIFVTKNKYETIQWGN